MKEVYDLFPTLVMRFTDVISPGNPITNEDDINVGIGDIGGVYNLRSTIAENVAKKLPADTYLTKMCSRPKNNSEEEKDKVYKRYWNIVEWYKFIYTLLCTLLIMVCIYNSYILFAI